MRTKPFNLQEALAGKPLVTRDGERVTGFRRRRGNLVYSGDYIAEMGGTTHSFYADGRFSKSTPSELDLLILDEEDILDGLTPEQVETVRAFAWAVRNGSQKGVERRKPEGWERMAGISFFADEHYRIAPAQPKFKVGDRVLCKSNGIKATVTQIRNGQLCPIRAKADNDKDIPWEFREDELALLKTITRPWTPEEAEGKWVRLKVCDSAAWKVTAEKWGRSMQALFDEYVQLDGSPCGVEEEVTV